MFLPLVDLWPKATGPGGRSPTGGVPRVMTGGKPGVTVGLDSNMSHGLLVWNASFDFVFFRTVKSPYLTTGVYVVS